jgi:acyl-CoA reductase-like NAD-dependent aldehyde dehydrogenase
MRHYELLIDGHFFGGPCDQGVGKTVSHSPYDGVTVGTAAEAGKPEAMAACAAASKAFEGWQVSSRRERIKVLRACATHIRARRAELCELMALEIGKPLVLAGAEVDRSALVFDLAADALTQPMGRILPADYDVRGDKVTILEERFPVGPVFCITPYNWPLMLAAHKVAPALAAGCTVVVKGSPLSPLCSLAFGSVLHEAGVPAGVVNFIQCDPSVAESAMTSPEIAAVSFTGSDRVGWHIKGLLPRKKVLLELGGDATALILADGDLKKAIPGCVKSAFGYAGQVCISLQKLIVADSLYDEAVEMAVAETEAIPYGDPLAAGTWCGPVISEESAQRIEDGINSAAEEGQLLAGGNRVGQVIQPTLLANVPSEHPFSRDEAFGPVLLIQKTGSFEEGAAAINSSRFGIHASVFTQNQTMVQRAFRELNVGGVVVNDAPNLRFDGMPYGGVKESGFGREGIESVIQELTEPRLLVHRWG